MSIDLLLLVLCAAATALGFWASLRLAARRKVAAWIAAGIFLLVGLDAALVVTIGGPGTILPGHQISPDLQSYWAGVELETQQSDEYGPPHPVYLLLALLAHALVLFAAPGRLALVLPLPATLVFLGLYAYAEDRDSTAFVGTTYRGETAYLTVVGERRLIFAVGGPDDMFVRVLHEHEAPSKPTHARLAWSRDGEIVTLTTQGGKPFFAFDRDGKTTGWLPTGEEEWPRFGKSAAESVAYQRKVSAARVEVARVLEQHGGPAER